MFPDLHLPTAEDERTDPEAADKVYEAATRTVISMTRDRDRFPLVYKENVNYGFRRNLWGLKPIGLVLSLAGAVICTAKGQALNRSATVLIPSIDWLMACAVCLGMASLWIFRIDESWVRVPAEAYAERLFESCKLLENQGGM